jgi:predicted ATPase
LVAVTTEQNIPHWRAHGTIGRGWLKVRNGDMTEGLSLLYSGSAAFRATGAEVLAPYHIGLLARACDIAGRNEDAVTQLDSALQLVEKTGERWFVAELNRLKGQSLLRQGQPEAAEELYCRALSIAREQEAKLWELRAATSLARLGHNRGQRAASYDRLAQIYSWFTEGFTTSDLREAKSLLDELA